MLQVRVQEREEGGVEGAGTSLHPQAEISAEGNLQLQARPLRVDPEGKGQLASLHRTMGVYVRGVCVFHPHEMLTDCKVMDGWLVYINCKNFASEAKVAVRQTSMTRQLFAVL